MIGMKNSATVLSAKSEFDAFLFAHIGEEKNGMLLSVLSALARLDLDPGGRQPSWPGCRSKPPGRD